MFVLTAVAGGRRLLSANYFFGKNSFCWTEGWMHGAWTKKVVITSAEGLRCWGETGRAPRKLFVLLAVSTDIQAVMIEGQAWGVFISGFTGNCI